jgi:hypothetical protein
MSLTVVRLILTAILLVPVYHETGTWTVVALALIAFAIEIESALLRLVLKTTKKLSRATEEQT